jgi:protein-tyrosine phosphatase
MHPRFIPIDGLRNLRDFGGVASHHGGMIASSVLYRAAHFGGLSDAGRAQLSALGLTALVDLRRRSERDETPNLVDGLGVATIASDLSEVDGETLAPHIAYLRDSDITEDGARDYMVGFYSRAIGYPQHLETFPAAFVHLAEGRGPVAVHCAAGKDRTGILCALILKVLGASDEHICEDYLLTNQQPDLELRVDDYTTMLEARFGRKIAKGVLRPMVGVEQAYLDTAFAAMETSYGGWENYLAAIGVDHDMQAAVRANLIVGV